MSQYRASVKMAIESHIMKPKGPVAKAFYDQSRFKVIVSGRRVGKTAQALLWLFMRAITCPNPLWENWYIAPYYKSAKDIAWLRLLEMIPMELIRNTNKSNLEITLANGNRIGLKGADKPDSLVGRAVYSAVFDEYALQKPDIWEYMRPSFSDTGGGAMFIGTPRGANHFRDLYYDSLEGKLKGFKSFPIFKTIDSPWVSAEEIAEARKHMDAKRFRQEYEATFETWDGLVYDTFTVEPTDTDPTCNVLPDIPYRPELDTYIGCDWGWNDDTVLLVKQYDKYTDTWHNIYEIVSPKLQPETIYKLLCGEEITIGGKKKQLPVTWENALIISGHEMNQSRQEAGGRSMKRILVNMGIPDRRIVVRRFNHGDRINSLRAYICNADGERKAFYSEAGCPRTIADKQAYHYPEKDGVAHGDRPDKSPANHRFSHTNDADEYVTEYVTPLKGKQQWRIG